MRLKILVPSETRIDREVTKVSAEAENGAFTLLPRHVDFATALAPGILSFEDLHGQEHFFAVDRGILVKRGPEVLVSVVKAFEGPDAGIRDDRDSEVLSWQRNWSRN